MSVQDTYVDRASAYEGMVSNAVPSTIINRTNKSSAFVADATLPKEVVAGRAIVPYNPSTPADTSRPSSCELAYQAAAEAVVVLGVSTRRLLGDAANDGTSTIPEGSEVGILQTGVIHVKVEDAVTAFAKPFVRVKKSGANVALGSFRSDADTATAVEAANMMYLDHGAANDLVPVQIFNANPVA